MQTVHVPEVVQQEAEAVDVATPAPARGPRWWAVPLAVVGAIALLASSVLSSTWSWGRTEVRDAKPVDITEPDVKADAGADAAPDEETEPDEGRFVDPEGLYTIQTGADWATLVPYNTGEERFAIGVPVDGYTPEVVIASGGDAFNDAEREARYYAEYLSGEDYEIQGTGAVPESHGALGFLEWSDPNGARGYTVVAVDDGTWIIAELLAPPSAYKTILDDVRPLLHSLRPTV